MKRHNLFHTPIWIYDFTEPGQLKQISNLSKLALQEKEETGEGIVKSNKGNSFHTKFNFLGDYSGSPLADLLTPLISRAVSDYGYDPAASVSIMYWSIVTNAGGYNRRHCHPNSLISGAFYTSAPEGSGELILCDPRYGKLMETTAGRLPNQNIHQYQHIKPETGRLVLFPSYLEHEVDESTCDEPRIIYSFNVNMLGVQKK